MNETQTSGDEEYFPDCRSVHQKRSEVELSCVSIKSDCSMDPPMKFKSEDIQPGLSSIHQKRSEAESSCVSTKRETSVIQSLEFKRRVLNTLRSNLLKKFECLCEGTATQRNPTLLNEIYTELYITESERGEINNEHEVRQIETQSRREATEDTAIKCSDIFRPLPGQDKDIRTVLTKGVAGIGKTVSVQKFILDWAEEKENQDVQLIFPLPFKEINFMKSRTLSLSDLLHIFFPEIKEMKISSDEYKVLFIFDGLDECRLSLDFKSKVKLCNISESASVDVLLMNLIVGNLLPSALIWITSRPAAADLVPSECVHRVTEIRGFNEPQKEEYFRKRISDQSLADRIISHLKSSRSLFIMCHIPVFCWISATVLEKILSQAETGEIPNTLTQMYTHFLILQTNIKHEKDYEKNVTDKDMILKLGKLAFQQLVKGNLIFYDKDLKECGIDVTEASIYSGLCTQIFREELGLFRGKVFCFVHLSLQEHLAALYVYLSFTIKNRNVFDQTKQSLLSKMFHQKKSNSLSELHQIAVNEALQSKNGHLDLFLRFLLGLSVESNQTLLRKLLIQTGSCPYNKEKTAYFIRQKITENHSSEKSINLFHCLNELGDDSLMQEIQGYLKSGEIRKTTLYTSQWSALVYVLLTSEQKMDVFDLKEFIGEQHTGDEVLQYLLPVVKESRSVRLCGCKLTAQSCGEKGCGYVSSALTSNPSHLRELDLSYNHPGDSGVKLLSEKLEDSACSLDKLNVDHGGEFRISPGMKKYGCFLTLDANTAHTRLGLSEENRKVSRVEEYQSYPDHPDRFDHWEQVLCRESVCGRCYWEIEWTGDVRISASYKNISRKGRGKECVFGSDDQSWSLSCSSDRYSFRHNNIETDLSVKPISIRGTDWYDLAGLFDDYVQYINRVGVFVDESAGTLSFYKVYRGSMRLIHTVQTTFTQTLYPGFTVWSGSVKLCC
ncbi:protein NLRC3-like [Puntigrus tetrazona]|uniref:protein NLRC3-like n=1 Tax=Puntigrus tetrazona TaxID=1606681 RepID=UPI001C894F41|nr:protein NLRC3-like [Puntigrus tetrazona]